MKATAVDGVQSDERLPQQKVQKAHAGTTPPNGAAETGSLARTPAQKKMPSAYSSLCSYVGSLAEEAGFQPETEVLRIPSTRNLCIVGRYRDTLAVVQDGDGKDTTKSCMEGRQQVVKDLVERELGKSMDIVSQAWIQRAESLAKKPGSGH